MVELLGVNIEGIVGCVPKHTIDNLEQGEKLFKKEIKKVIKATGIEKRRICKKSDTTALDLCVAGAKKLIKDLSINKNDFGTIIFVTSTPDYVMPNNATLVQDLLEFPKSMIAYDINLACSGYAFGLFNAAMTVKATGKKVLLLDGDKQSHFTSTEDRATSLIFGDGGSATVISPSKSSLNKWIFEFETDGSRHQAINVKHGGSKYWIREDSLDVIEREDGSKLKKSDITMDGMGVFNFATKEVPANIRKLIESSNIDLEKIDILALHQANKFMLRQIAKSLKFPLAKTPMTVSKYGNTSSSTIPLLLATHSTEELSNKKILLSGFGAGLSIGTAYLELEECISVGVLEYEE